MTKNNIIILILGSISVILISLGLLQINATNYIGNFITGVGEQKILSVFIAVFIIFSIGILFFAKEWLMYFSGILFGFSIAALSGGYNVSLFLLIFLFSNELRRIGMLNNKGQTYT